MKTTSALTIGSLMLVSLTAFSLNARSAGDIRPAFDAEIRGDVRAHPVGDARFGAAGGAGVAPAVFTISLEADTEEGSVLFTRQGSESLIPGTYPISEDVSATGVRALVMTGSATEPTGVFRGQSGSLVITSVSDSAIRGSFRIDAAGYLTDELEVEDRTVSVSGSFTATKD